MDIIEEIICHYLYCPGMRNIVRKEVTNCDIFQCTKQSNIKYGKLPASLAE